MWRLSNSDGKKAHIFRQDVEIKGNKIIIINANGVESEVTEIPNLRVDFKGGNGLLRIHEPFRINRGHFIIGERGYIEIGNGFRIRSNLYIDAGAENVTVKFGEKANVGAASILAGDEPGTEVIIGDELLTAQNVYLRNADGHTLYDLKTKQPINVPQFGIHIGNHVWLGYGVTLLKDADIPNNCVVGACSLVGKASFVENSVIAGVPAKTLFTGVMWDSRSIDSYCKGQVI